MYSAGDVRLEELTEPKIIEATDVIVRTAATCICGSDLWDYRGINPIPEPKPFGHEYRGIIDEICDNVTSVTPGTCGPDPK
jgi:threonine dehydrogenase-like Zn-dependent dehydrogenase